MAAAAAAASRQQPILRKLYVLEVQVGVVMSGKRMGRQRDLCSSVWKQRQRCHWTMRPERLAQQSASFLRWFLRGLLRSRPHRRKCEGCVKIANMCLKTSLKICSCFCQRRSGLRFRRRLPSVLDVGRVRVALKQLVLLMAGLHYRKRRPGLLPRSMQVPVPTCMPNGGKLKALDKL